MAKIEYGADFALEFKLAEEQQRQPKCVSCGKLLDRITQMQYDSIAWNWDEKTKKFIKEKNEYSGDSDKPKCDKCGYGESEMLDMENGTKMGVEY